MNVGIVVQARLGSTRLPRKVLKMVVGRTVLDRCLDACEEAAAVIGAKVILAVPRTDAELRRRYVTRVPLVAGDEADVLSRYVLAAKTHALDVIARVTSDCPILHPALVVRALQTYLRRRDGLVYVAVTGARRFPSGWDCEVFSADRLKRVAQRAEPGYDREHVCPLMYAERRVGLRPLVAHPYLHCSVDTQADLRRVVQVVLSGVAPFRVTGDPDRDLVRMEEVVS